MQEISSYNTFATKIPLASSKKLKVIILRGKYTKKKYQRKKTMVVETFSD
jgi:hypothetical protein